MINQSQVIEEQNKKLELINSKLKTSNDNLLQFASIAAHDLKAPLRTINGFSQILSKKYAEVIEEKDKEKFDFIINGGKSLKDMIDGLLNYSRISNEDLVLTSINLENLISFTLDNLRATIEEKGAIITTPNSFPIINGHFSLLNQVFLNLINNSLKFTRIGVKPIIKILWENYDQDFILISITDNGIGIEEKHQKEVFKMFIKLHSSTKYKGNGIGLSTCKKIIESFGGVMWLKSKINEGTTFYFTLPIDSTHNNKYT